MDRSKVIALLEQSNVLPKLPDKYQTLFAALASEETNTFETLSDAISRCDELDGFFLSFINSGYFSIRRKADTIRDAVAFFGLHTTKTLIIAYVVRVLLSGSQVRTVHFKHSVYWNHIVGTSVAAEQLYGKRHPQDKHRMFIYGLIHDIGVSVMSRCIPDLLDNIVEIQLERNLHQIIAERQVLGGLTHSDIGAWICERWRLPEDITHMVCFHHRPYTASAYAEELKHLHIADLISTNYYERLIGFRHTDTYPLEMLKQIGTTVQEVEQIGVDLPGLVDGWKARMDFDSFFSS